MLTSICITIALFSTGFVAGKLQERTSWTLCCNKQNHKDLLYRNIKGKPYFIETGLYITKDRCEKFLERMK